MDLTEKINNQIYSKVNEWLIEHNCININVYEMDEKEVFFWAMQAEYPGVSKQLTDDFFRIAKQLMR